MVIMIVVSMWISGAVSAMIFRSACTSWSRSRHRPARAPKILTPLDDPFGPVLELIKWAEKRAVEAHRRAFPDSPDHVLRDHSLFDGLASLEDRHPALDRETLGRIRERFLEENRTGQPTVLEDYSFTTINERRVLAGFGIPPAQIDDRYIHGTGDGISNRRQYGRYLNGIGYVTADNPDLLKRACLTVLRNRYEGHEARLRALDRKLASAEFYSEIKAMKDLRFREWEHCKRIVKEMEKLEAALRRPP